MHQATNGIVLRSIKYGETSLISTIFTQEWGIQAYLIKGIRTTKTKHNRAALLQPATLLQLVPYHNPKKNLQFLREFHHAHIYQSIQQEVVKNTIALFSVELLLRLLPEHAPLPPLFHFAYHYFIALDQLPPAHTANFPLWFIIQCSHHLGYQLHGHYTPQTPHLNLPEGGFSPTASQLHPHLTEQDAQALSAIIAINNIQELKHITITPATRYRLIEWYIQFLHRHTDHLAPIKSLTILHTIMH
ncbi:MAG TPA: DNA repair protein RecO [Flavipsychrobacter sp.]|nr:DNA repair protein RecO [Flavipsychrobacter sp.]